MRGRICPARLLRLTSGALFLLAGFTCQAAAAEPQLLGRTRRQWSAQLAADGLPRKSQAAWAIGQFATEQIEPGNAQEWLDVLGALAASDDSAVRYWGVQGLARSLPKLDAKDAARAAGIQVLIPLLKDPAAGPRLAAAEAVAQLGEPDQGLPVLVAALSSPQEAVRIQAIASLERLGPAAQPAEAQIRAATSDASEYVKRISTRALKNLSRQ
ncbi:MAG: HEAT repeat domain-containing protein [Pirellulaceae bacterium]